MNTGLNNGMKRFENYIQIRFVKYIVGGLFITILAMVLLIFIVNENNNSNSSLIISIELLIVGLCLIFYGLWWKNHVISNKTYEFDKFNSDHYFNIPN